MTATIHFIAHEDHIARVREERRRRGLWLPTLVSNPTPRTPSVTDAAR